MERFRDVHLLCRTWRWNFGGFGYYEWKIRTVDHILGHVIHAASHLATAVFVLSPDGDKATWNSARKYFTGCKIVLCASHAAKNITKRLGPLCRKNISLSGNPKKASRWIQCQKNKCIIRHFSHSLFWHCIHLLAFLGLPEREIFFLHKSPNLFVIFSAAWEAQRTILHPVKYFRAEFHVALSPSRNNTKTAMARWEATWITCG